MTLLELFPAVSGAIEWGGSVKGVPVVDVVTDACVFLGGYMKGWNFAEKTHQRIRAYLQSRK